MKMYKVDSIQGETLTGDIYILPGPMYFSEFQMKYSLPAWLRESASGAEVDASNLWGVQVESFSCYACSEDLPQLLQAARRVVPHVFIANYEFSQGLERINEDELNEITEADM